MKILILFIYSTVAFSICQSNIELPLSEFISEMGPILAKPWAAASDEQVTTHKCQKPALSLNEMEDFLSKSETLSSSLDLLLNKEGSFTREAISTDLSLYKADDCEDEICKAKKVFGNSEGIELLYMIEKYGLNGSHLVHKETKAWTSKMIKPYLVGLAAVPDFMLPIEKNQQFTKSSIDSDDIADASISFYGGIDKFSDTRVTYTTFHEIAHYVAGSIHIEDDEKWMLASGWKDDLSSKPVDFTSPEISFTTEPISLPSFSTSISAPRSTYGSSLSLGSSRAPSAVLSTLTSTDFGISTAGVQDSLNRTKKLLFGMKNDDQEKFISRYAQTNPLEDIAESITAYRFNPEKLKEVSPDRYNYIKENVFLGVEYLSESNCDTAASKRQQFESILKPE